MLNFIFALIAPLAFAQPQLPHTIEMPMTEIRFGTEIRDEFKWLENPADPRISSWILQQNEYTKYKLADEDFQEFLLDFKELFTSTSNKSLSDEFQSDEFLFERRFIPSPKIDENTIESTKFYTLATITESGGDYKRLNIYRNEDGDKKTLIETLHLGRTPSIVWANEHEFFYTNSGHHLSGDFNQRLLLHKIGEHQADDIVIHRANDPKDYFYIQEDGASLFLVEMNYGSKASDYYKLSKTNGKGDFLYSYPGYPYHSKAAKNGGFDITTVLYDEFSNGGIYRVNTKTNERKLLVSELGFPIEDISVYKDDFIIKSPFDGEDGLYYLKTSTNVLTKFDLPRNAMISNFYEKDNLLILSLTSHTIYYQTYEINLDNFEVNKTGDHSFSNYDQEIEVINEHYIASNGQKAAIQLVKFKSTELTPATPIFMEGYGGFNISVTPYYTPEIIPWLKRGGVFANIVLPGGFEYGKDWFESGILLNKKNTFDSYALAAKRLIEKGYTSPKHIGIGGTSNGGLLASATAMLYPHLFAAVVPEVGVHDLLNFQFFTSGRYWVDNYGQYDNEEHFRYFFKLSPYHNVEHNETYPDTLILTAQDDDRVVPSHSYKLAAKLQKHFPENEILLYSKPMGSHSSRSGSMSRRLETYSLKWNFLMKKLMK